MPFGVMIGTGRIERCCVTNITSNMGSGAMIAVIQAGGKGARLRPYTMVLPKPLMPVGSQPVLELLLKWLRRNGTHDVYMTTGYLGHLIRSVCGDGRQWDLSIHYTEETQPLGTMGALSLIKDKINSTFLVINGDVLTDLSINAFTAFHRQHRGLLSVAVAKRNVHIDFGVIEQQANLVTGFIEKPLLCHIVSTGIYCLEPQNPRLDPEWRSLRLRRFDALHVRQEACRAHLPAQWAMAGHRQGRGLPTGAGAGLGGSCSLSRDGCGLAALRAARAEASRIGIPPWK